MRENNKNVQRRKFNLQKKEKKKLNQEITEEMIVQLNKMMHSLLVSLVCIHIILLLCTQIGGSNCQNRENFNRRGKLISSSEEDEEIILKKNPVIEQKLKSLQKGKTIF